MRAFHTTRISVVLALVLFCAFAFAFPAQADDWEGQTGQEPRLNLTGETKRAYYPSGALKTVFFSNGFRSYYENGMLESEVSVKNKKMDGPVFHYYENGRLQSEYDYKEDSPSYGRTRLYYESGPLQSETVYSNKGRDHILKSYHENGQLEHEAIYKNNTIDGFEKFYDENGKLQYQNQYKNGELVRTIPAR